MKKILFAAMAMTAILASCSKDAINTNLITDTPEGPQVQITLTAAGPGTRAFFDDTAVAEPAECEIKTMCIYIFDQSDKFLARRLMTASEIADKTARIGLPASTRGTVCTFYVVANDAYGIQTDISYFAARTEFVTLDNYNGFATETIYGRKRSAGFVMTGMATATIAQAGETTNVALTVKRTVAKIAVKSELSAAFKTKYINSDVVITSATLSQAKGETFSFPNAAIYNPGVRVFTHTQSSYTTVGNSASWNLFYVYENEAISTVEERLKLVLSGYFDADGKSTTTDDRSDVSYVIYLQGNGNGDISRNGYYRVEAMINEPSGDGLTVNFTVADWQTPVTQSVDLGV